MEKPKQFIASAFMIAVILMMAPVFCRARTILTYPNMDGVGEKGYGIQLLRFVLEKIDAPYTVRLHQAPVNQERAFHSLEKGIFDVLDGCCGNVLEHRADAVYIPIDRGLMGWRLFIIHQDQAPDFSRIKTLDDLKTKTAGQGIQWIDTRLLTRAGISVVTSPEMETLMRMVNAGRFDFLPLGLPEVYGFLSQYRSRLPDIRVEPSLVLVYPFARFFYVRKGNTRLKKDIEKGLEAAFSDGSFQDFVLGHPLISQGLSRADLGSRTAIFLKNPLATDAFRRIDPKWWYDPTAD